MVQDNINKMYFEWLFDFVCARRYRPPISYRKLLSYLHYRDFTYIISRDENRACDGIDLRYRFMKSCWKCSDRDVLRALDRPCSVLEMMVALALTCEETIMDDPLKGDRTGQWFWGMINSMGLGTMIDDEFDQDYVEDVVDRFLNREYSPDGHGGLFVIKNCDRDLRNVEIWNQLCWYLDCIS